MFTLPRAGAGGVFTKDGKRLVSIDKDGTVTTWDAAKGRQLSACHVPIDAPNPFHLPAFDPLGAYIAALGKQRGSVVTRSTTGGHEMFMKTLNTSMVTGADFSPDSRYLAVVDGEGALYVLNATTGWEALVLRSDIPSFSCVAYSPDGKWLAAAGEFPRLDQPGRIVVWDATPREETVGMRFPKTMKLTQARVFLQLNACLRHTAKRLCV